MIGRLGCLVALLWLLGAPPVAAAGCPAQDPAAAAAAIGQGHAFGKHVVAEHQFAPGSVVAGLAFRGPAITDRDAFARFLQGIVGRPSETRPLSNRRQAYWHTPTGTVVILNAKAGDCGTAFRPDAGKAYFDRLR
ncbi:MAG: hypothetical protein GC191_07060 [Azospirillum sp.]|nr:hypothetical protein [Azospirillum sp.]